MALRLSGILMGNSLCLCLSFSLYFHALTESFSSTLFLGGVVIVYERKVKLLYGTIWILIMLNFKSQFHYFDFWRNCYI